MNSPVTRIQVFAVWALCAIMLLGTIGAVVLLRLDGRLPETPQQIDRHGIETTWPSAIGENRLWSIGTNGSDFTPWLAQHVAAVTQAQRLMPLTR